MTATKIFTIYSECDHAVAQAMSDEGKVRLMPFAMEGLPDGHSVNALGMPALGVISLPHRHRREYERRVALLRA